MDNDTGGIQHACKAGFMVGHGKGNQVLQPLIKMKSTRVRGTARNHVGTSLIEKKSNTEFASFDRQGVKGWNSVQVCQAVVDTRELTK
jgi:hypothetical protein